MFIRIINNNLVAWNHTAFQEYTKEVAVDYHDYISNPGKWIFNGSDFDLNPNYEAERLQQAKNNKYNEANTGAKTYIDNGRALYELTPTRHIEATDGNIGKFGAYALGYVTGEITGTVIWNTKEDENIELNQTDVQQILKGLGLIQAQVWTVKFQYYKNLINNAQTVAEVNAIEINYDINLEEEIDYSKFTVAQLKAMADERNIQYTSNILKADLINLLKGDN